MFAVPGTLSRTSSSRVYSHVLSDLTTQVVRNREELLDIIIRGNNERATGATKQNDQSSRSHAILTIHIEISVRVYVVVRLKLLADMSNRSLWMMTHSRERAVLPPAN